MAVTIEKRPVGVVLGDAVSAVINSDYSSAFATVNSTAHGLSDGQYVYVKSNVENYNGFWKIEVTNSNEFLLIDNPYVAWIVDANVTYYPQVTTHGWSCVHLPIVYELSNTRYPINTVDTARTISSISNDLGYLNLNLSGSLGTFNELAFVKISNAPDSNLNGVYQVIDKISTSDVTVNLAYTAAPNTGIVGATVQLYYANYNVLVRIYAGLNSSHEWSDQKPYALAATLQFIPDSSNRIKFSVSEILKAFVNTENNLTLATLPNNIDAFTQFYIEVAEQYDTSNGYTVTTLTSGYASDQLAFEGYAVNAMLAFKNVHSGYLSDYIMNHATAKFLTLFVIPVFLGCSDDEPNCYNEVTFIKPSTVGIILNKQYYSSGVSGLLETETITGDEGLYRVPIVANCDYDRVDISINEIIDTPELSEFQTIVGVGISWIEGSAPSVTLGASNSSEDLRADFIGNGYRTYRVNYDITNTNGNSGQVSIGFRSSSLTSLGLFDINLVQGSNVGYIDVSSNNPSVGIAYIRFTASSGADAKTVTINSYSIDSINVSETKEFKIDCGCSNQEIRISWMNNLGAMETPWAFTGESEHAVDILNTGETRVNTFPSWPNSYGEFADTDKRKQTFRETANRKFVYSQLLTEDEADAISYIKSSPLVQIVNSRTDRRTVIVDTDSFTKFADGDKTFTVQFNILYTDDIPSQT